ncbi:MAG: hypothetical protein JSS20_20900 [Proteobacteria bacterium]|nr:hypothetical protein [Pseudomonadota bacterium]
MIRSKQPGASSPMRGSQGAAQRSSNITPGHVRAFQAVTSQLYDNVTLWSCSINGEPGVAIVMAEPAERGAVRIMPLFVALTESMVVEFDGEQGGSGGSSRSPQRYDVLRQHETLEPGGAS